MVKPQKQATKSKVKKNKPGFRAEPCDTGRKILAALSAAGWNAQDLARSMGVSNQTVHRWLTGECGLSFLVQEEIRAKLGAGAC